MRLTVEIERPTSARLEARGRAVVEWGMRVFVAGATGYIGRHLVRELVGRGDEVVAFAREHAGVGGAMDAAASARVLAGAEVRFGDVTSRASLAADGFRGERFGAVVSCLASRSGGIDDAWRIEHRANADLLSVALEAGAEHFTYLSAICVQAPQLEFQRAKLAFEAELEAAPITHSIVRPTAFFKSLAGQVERVRRGKPFLMFGDGELTRCKPIGEGDLARFIADCRDDASRHDATLPIGGPGEAVTPRRQGELLFAAFDRAPRFRRVPVAMFDAAIATLGLAGRFSTSLRDKAELARIGRFYATESMLVRDPETGRYDADATPSFGEVSLADFYRRVAEEGLDGQELGDHALFDREP